MKKSFLMLLMALLSLTARAAYRSFQVNGIYYEQTEAADDFVSVSYVPEGGPMYKGDIVIPATVSYEGKTFPVKKIGQGAFYGCTGLTSIVLPEGLEEIGSSSFYSCTSLKGITLPTTLKFIRENLFGTTAAFERCTGLKSIYFPPTMNSYESWTPNIHGFNNCTGLKTIFVAGKQTGIGLYGAFEGCTSVTDFVSYIENPSSFDVDARNFEAFNQTASLVVPDGKKTAYQNARWWYTFQHIYERSSYSKAFAVLTAGIGGKLTYNNDNVWRATQVYGVQKGQAISVVITPDEGHKLLHLLKDGQDVTAQVSDGKYTVQNVQKDFTLEAVFEEGTTPSPQPQPGSGGTAKLSIEPFSIKAGETATMLIDMTNPDDEITALDFFLQLPEGLSIVTEDGEAVVDIAGRTTWKKHSLTMNINDGHIMLYSSTNATLSGTSGAIISVKLLANSTFKGGDIRLTNQVLNTPVPVVSKPADYVYTIEVKAAEEFSTIVIDKHGIQTYCDSHDLDFSAVTGLKAYIAGGFDTATGEALMMRVSSTPAETGLILVGPEGTYKVPRKPSSCIYVNLLKGVLEATGINWTDNGYTNYAFDGISKNFISGGGTGVWVYANTVYLQIPTSAAGSRYYISLKFDDTTAIDGQTADGKPFDVYSLSGTLLRQGVTSLQQLPRGIYVVGGRKVAVK